MFVQENAPIRQSQLGDVSPSRGRTITDVWPLLAAITFYWAAVGVMIVLAIRHTEWTLFYPLDDTWIHMAIAKHFAEFHVWGVTRYAFTSSTSSPLWTFLLAIGYCVVGTNSWMPLVLNLFFGTLLLVFLSRKIQDGRAIIKGTILLCVVAITSLPALAVLGMEHTLHTLLTVVFVFNCVDSVVSHPTRADKLVTVLMAMLLPMARYEGLFAVAMGCLLIARAGRIRFAALLAAVASFPVVLYGLFCQSKGWCFLPNSILLKGHPLAASSIDAVLESMGQRAARVLTANGDVVALTIMSVIAYCLFGGPTPYERRQRLLAFMFMGILLLQLQFADVGWLYRYEGYLIALGLVSGLPAATWVFDRLKKTEAPLISSNATHIVPLICVAAILVYPLLTRTRLALMETSQSISDRYHEHVMPAQFVNAYYPSATIMVNDIGAVCYYSDCRVLDLFGLGNMAPLIYRRTSGYTRNDVRDWAASEQTKIAILQVHWPQVAPRIPPEWIKVAEWEIPRNVVFGDKQIGFFAVDRSEATNLAKNIHLFLPRLPKDVKVTMYDLPAK